MEDGDRGREVVPLSGDVAVGDNRFNPPTRRRDRYVSPQCHPVHDVKTSVLQPVAATKRPSIIYDL